MLLGTGAIIEVSFFWRFTRKHVIIVWFTCLFSLKVKHSKVFTVVWSLAEPYPRGHGQGGGGRAACDGRLAARVRAAVSSGGRGQIRHLRALAWVVVPSAYGKIGAYCASLLRFVWAHRYFRLTVERLRLQNELLQAGVDLECDI